MIQARFHLMHELLHPELRVRQRLDQLVHLRCFVVNQESGFIVFLWFEESFRLISAQSWCLFDEAAAFLLVEQLVGRGWLRLAGGRRAVKLLFGILMSR